MRADRQTNRQTYRHADHNTSHPCRGEVTESRECVQQEATSSLKLPNVAGIFYILLSGLCMSLLIAGVEFLHKSRTEARRRRVSALHDRCVQSKHTLITDFRFTSGLLKNNKHTIAKVRKNANRHGGKNATVTK